MCVSLSLCLLRDEAVVVVICCVVAVVLFAPGRPLHNLYMGRPSGRAGGVLTACVSG